MPSHSDLWMESSTKKASRSSRSSKEPKAVPVDLALVRVACFTTDFTMQNVLLQLALSVLSTQGKLVREVKKWVLRCMACYTIQGEDMSRLFCKRCGVNHLSRIAVTIDQTGKLPSCCCCDVLWFCEDSLCCVLLIWFHHIAIIFSPLLCSIHSPPFPLSGKMHLHLKKNYRTDTAGMQYSLPAAGKQDRFEGELLLREDQLLHGIWRQKVVKINKDVKSAFGEDVTSDVGIQLNKQNAIHVGFGKNNPNAQKGRERRGQKKRG